jgi:hypothetical protein
MQIIGEWRMWLKILLILSKQQTASKSWAIPKCLPRFLINRGFFIKLTPPMNSTNLGLISFKTI